MRMPTDEDGAEDEGEVAKLDERRAHALVVHTDDPDEPKLELTYSMKPARPR
jgi:hypothetical protein